MLGGGDYDDVVDHGIQTIAEELLDATHEVLLLHCLYDGREYVLNVTSADSLLD